VSTAEIDRTDVTFTVDTVTAIANAVQKKAKLYFIVGADAFLDILSWKNPEMLFKLVSFAVMTRPGTDTDMLRAFTEELKVTHKTQIYVLRVPSLDISSTEIRRRVETGISVKYLVPEKVIDIISEHSLYARPISVDDIKLKLSRMLNGKRFSHSVSVANEAKRLAEVHGADPLKAAVAGLLHDMAKGMPDASLFNYALKHEVVSRKEIKTAPGIIHAFVGAHTAKTVMGITCADILNAVRYHTTGRPHMSLLEKIVFTADYIEPSRPVTDETHALQKYAEFDLDTAVIEILTLKIKNAGSAAHPLSIKALGYMLSNLPWENADV
jgi:nicotinate-nucleotide adenylyltransferase